VTYSFVHSDLFATVGQNPDNAFKLSNAISPDLQYYRQSLLPSLLEKVHPNIKSGFDKLALFEINQTHTKDLIDENNLPIEEHRLGLVFAADDKTAATYSGAAYYAARSYLDHLLASLGIDAKFEVSTTHEPKMEVGKAAIAPFERPRAAYVKTKDGKLLGEIGEFKASVRRKLKLPRFSAGFELDVLRLHETASKLSSYMKLSRFPKVEQDMTLKVAEDLEIQQLDQAVAGAINKLVDFKTTQIGRSLTGIYQKTGETTKNVTYRFVVASFERTLTALEVNNLLDQIADELKQAISSERV
jgi:phenylalanyl-tRNA synthetase beta chain